MSSGFSLSWNQAINLWYNEVNDYAYPSGTTTGAETGHYTQVSPSISSIPLVKTHCIIPLCSVTLAPPP